MCTTCGCGSNETLIDGQPHTHDHAHPHDHAHGHSHDHDHDHAHAPAPGVRRRVRVEQDLLAKNNALAAANREAFRERGLFVLNLVSSPGSGKTTLLVETIQRLKAQLAIAVIEGDQQTSFDADRIREAGVPAIQINTGKGCHLDAHMVGHAAQQLEALKGGLLLVENVGNLVCPASFDLGEAHKVVILSVTEGDDKPFKYPDMFAASDLLIINKIDLLPYVKFDVERCIHNALSVNPKLQVLRLSATTGENMEAWTSWIQAGVRATLAGRAELVAELKARLAAMEAQLDAMPGLRPGKEWGGGGTQREAGGPPTGTLVAGQQA